MLETLSLDLLKKCLTASLYEESGWQILNQMKVNDEVVVALLRRAPLNLEARELGRDWPFFAYSMIGHRRFENILFCIDEVLRHDVPGDVAEAGVWRGGATIWMRLILKVRGVTDRIVWVADSFDGMPPKTGRDAGSVDPDLSTVGYLKVSLEQVRANFARFGALDDQVRFIKGWFKDSLPAAPIERLAVLRVDCDLYESTIAVLQQLYHRVSPGGFVIIDDYLDWAGCRTAVDEFRAAQDITAVLQPVDRNAVYWQVPRDQDTGPRASAAPQEA